MNSTQEVHADANDNANSAETSNETSIDKTPQNLNIEEGQSTTETSSGDTGQADNSLTDEEADAKKRK